MMITPFSENHTIDLLQRKCFTGYLYFMIANLLLYLYLSWPLLAITPLNLFSGLILLMHVLALWFCYRSPFVKELFSAFVSFSVIIALPLIVTSHMFHNMGNYIWITVAAISFFVAYPDMKNIHRIYLLVAALCLTAMLMTLSTTFAYLLKSAEWFREMTKQELTVRALLPFIHPMITGACLIFYIVYYIVRIKEEQLAYELEAAHNKESHSRSGEQTPAKRDKLYNNIIRLLEEDKCYLNPNFNLAMLATMLNSNSAYIQEALKLAPQASFNDLVNYYRVEHVKSLLLDNQHNTYTLEHIYNASGFSSQSTFNRAFKKHIGMTPQEFCEQQNHDV
jgi:AraC-like DNA-binding protein